MPFYSLAIIPLIQRLSKSVIQAWYADDASACGKLSYGCGGTRFLSWDLCLVIFPMQGKLDLAHLVFTDTYVNVTADGRPYLGATIGSQDELEVLALFATTQVQASLAAFSRGLISKWLFIARTVPNVGNLFQPLENCVRHFFILSITGYLPPGDFERDLLCVCSP